MLFTKGLVYCLPANLWDPVSGDGRGTRTPKGYQPRQFSRLLPHPAGLPPYHRQFFNSWCLHDWALRLAHTGISGSLGSMTKGFSVTLFAWPLLLFMRRPTFAPHMEAFNFHSLNHPDVIRASGRPVSNDNGACCVCRPRSHLAMPNGLANRPLCQHWVSRQIKNWRKKNGTLVVRTVKEPPAYNPFFCYPTYFKIYRKR